jgi:hypothetical protein
MSPPLTLRHVPPAELPDLGPGLHEILVRMARASYGQCSAADIEARIRAGHWTLLGVFAGPEIIAGATFYILPAPQIRYLRVTFLAGEGGFQWGGAMLRKLEEVARDNGCNRLRFEGRPEWRRVLAPAGYEATSLNYEKAITP